MRILMLLLLLGLMAYLQHLGLPVADDLHAHSLLAFGFLVLLGNIFGDLSRRVDLPRITGYLLAGIICGGDLLVLLDRNVHRNLDLINEIALTFIAFTAGGELRLETIRERLGTITRLVSWQILWGILGVGGVFFLLFTVFGAQTPQTGLALALLLGTISVAVSPSTTVAVIVETKARGSLKDVVLGTTVLMDVLIILLFTLALSVARPLLSSGGGLHLREVLMEILLSLFLGAGVGLLGILILKLVQRHLALVILGWGLLLVSVARDFHLDSLLAAMVGGFIITNFSTFGKTFLEKVETASLPLFLVFFSLAGAGLDLKVLLGTWTLALWFVLSRLGAKFLSTRLAGGNLEAKIRNFAWMGFLGQAGVSLGFAVIVAQQFPGPGDLLKQIIVAAIIVNQIMGPILLKYAFDRTGESQG